MSYQPQYFLGQGKVFIAQRDAAGNPKAMRWLGDVDDAKISLKTGKIERKESWSGERGKALSISVDKEASIDLTLMEFSKENLSFALFGKTTSTASGSVTGEQLTSGLLVGDRIPLKNPNVSAVVITDSAATPATVNPSKYEVDPKYGAITIKDVAGLTQPLIAAYSHGAVDSVAIFASTPDDLFLRYEGINLAQGGAPIVVELYRVKSEPLKELSLITDKQGDMKVNAEVLIDSTKPADGAMGRFGRIIQVSTA
ncbi:MAG: hypothetical protein WA071_05840 [Undibacterium umbellatum]|uniref:phage tail tube protein n=1 Tax=Undibacterium umbellatum TaxID=2762300 RepID=UPI003BB6BEF5